MFTATQPFTKAVCLKDAVTWQATWHYTHVWMVDNAVQSVITATWRVTVRHTNVWTGDGAFRCVIRTTWQPALLCCWSKTTGQATGQQALKSKHRRTDGIGVAYTRYSTYAIACKKGTLRSLSRRPNCALNCAVDHSHVCVVSRRLSRRLLDRPYKSSSEIFYDHTIYLQVDRTHLNVNIESHSCQLS